MERGRLKEKEYWLSKLAGEWERTCVPHGYPAAGKKRENKAGRELETVHLGFTGELCGRLLKLSKDSNPMLHMILTAGLAVLLTGYTDSSDIIVGTPIYKQESEGKFINTVLVLRNRVSPGMTFKELLLEVRQDILESVAHQNFPLETLSVELGLPVSVGQCPLFDITLLLDNIHDKRYIEHLSTSINFSFNRSGQRIGGVMEYDGLIYDKPVMEQMARHFIRLLGQGVLHVDTALSQLEFLSDEERKKLLVDFNDTQADYPREKTLDRLFAEQAERTPEKIAIVGSWQLAVGKGERTGEVAQLTYRELNEKSSQLARVLREKGVEADTIVGLMVYPGVDMLIGLMAVLKAGGAYLPMDPYFPPSRICSWLKDSSTGILLTHGPLMAAMKMEWDREVILLEDETLYRGDGPGPAPPAESARLAYVIYTSGSTGIPRGVLIEHRSILNYVSWRIAAYGHTAGDISLQLISFSFDGFGANLYPCLLTGGTLLLPDQDQLKSTGYIRGLIRDMKVTNFSIVPSLYRVILEGGEPGDFRSLRFVVLAGEKTSEDLICMSNELIPGLRLINEYGPTENSVTTAAHPGMNPENPAVIGRPIANNRVFILDGGQNPRPQGIPGELCVSGEGLARGYLNSPELTANRFFSFSYKSYRSYRTYFSKKM